MVTYPIYFLDGYKEVSHVIKQQGVEYVRFEKDGESFTMMVQLSRGKRCGSAYIVDEAGNTMESLIYVNGHLNGKCKHHYPDGNIEMECMVVDDRMEGEFTEFDEMGEAVCCGKYVKGQRIEMWVDRKKRAKSAKTPRNEPDKKETVKDSKKSSNKYGAAAAGGAAAAAGTAAATGAFGGAAAAADGAAAAAAAAGGAAAAAGTAAATGAVGGAAALLGFGSPGIAAGSAAASMMSAAWTSGIGTGLVSAAQSAGATFMNAVGGSTLAAGAAVAAPVVAGAAVAGGIYYLWNRKNDGKKEKKKETQKK